jgi:hypothetical protein
MSGRETARIFQDVAMPKTTLDVLLTLLASPPGTHELQIIPNDENEALPAAVAARMDRVVATISASWGPPIFHGYWFEDGYRGWVSHDRLAYWHRQGRFAFVGCNISLDDSPIGLFFGVSDGSPD